MKKGNLEPARTLVQRFNTLTRPTPESTWLLLRIERRRGDAVAEAASTALLKQRFPDSDQAARLTRGEFD